MRDTEQVVLSNVYLRGDPNPLELSILPEYVAARVYGDRDDFWTRLPLSDGREAIVRTEAVVAVLPVRDDDDE